jgi:hypothetical protein
MWHVWVTAEVEEAERKGSLGSERRKWENRPHIKMIKKWDTEAWTGLIWLRIGTGGGLLTVTNFQVQRMRGIS